MRSQEVIYVQFQVQYRLLHLAELYKRHSFTLHCVPVGKEKNSQIASDLAENCGDGKVFQHTDYHTAGCHLRYQVRSLIIVLILRLF